MVGAGVRAAPGPHVSGVVAHGWNMSSEFSRACPCCGGGCVGGTLLGPEGTSAGCPAVWWGAGAGCLWWPVRGLHRIPRSGVGSFVLRVLGLWVGVGVCECRVVFENWIVVANELHLYLCCVCLCFHLCWVWCVFV